MRILICAHDAPMGPVDGFRLHLSALIRELRGEHDLRVLALRHPDQVTGPTDDLDTRWVRGPSTGMVGKAVALPTAIVQARPLGVSEMASRMRGPLREELVAFRPHVVHVTTQKLALLGPEMAGRASVLAALDAWHRTVEADIDLAGGLRRLLIRRQLAWVRRLEATDLRAFGRVVVVSDEDREALLTVDPSLPIEVIPNGVDADWFAPPIPPSDSTGLPQPDADRVVFTGVMSYSPNIAAAEFLARRVMPRVRAARASARLAIVGRDPSPAVTGLRDLPGVEVVGAVPDLRPWLWGSGVYACPMVSGTGIKNKLLEAMAAGAATVVTPRALQGIRARPNEEVLVGSTEAELADQIVRVLSDERLAAALGAAARGYVRKEHSWTSMADAYERVYTEVRGHR
jgi:glycosyltransferase involved in cell wall biosynthesis